MKSKVPTGITAYRDPATGKLAGSYPQPGMTDREILKLANEMASNRDGYGVAFYNDALLEFANKITADAEEEAARWKRAAEANIEENVRLRERCNPSKVVMIGDTGHYVSEAVSAEIERLRRPGYVLVPIEPTADMLYAMAECDGYQRGDRDHPMLTRWEDYWRMALSVLTHEGERNES